MSGLGPGFQSLRFMYSALLGIPDGNLERFRDHTKMCGGIEKKTKATVLSMVWGVVASADRVK